MIGVRVTCDAGGCGRHFDAAAVVGPVADADELLACAHRSDARGEPAVYLVGNVVLPSGWVVVNEAQGGEGVPIGERFPSSGRPMRVPNRLTRTYCADHAPA